MTLQRANNDINNILSTFEMKFQGATAAQRALLVETAKAALEKIRKAFLHKITEKKLTRTPANSLRLIHKVAPKSHALIIAKLDQKVRNALERIDRIADAG